MASITDAIDGYLARKYNQITELGKFLDPLADKLLIAAALLALVYLEKVAAWVAAVIILRDKFYYLFPLLFHGQRRLDFHLLAAKKKTMFQIHLGIAADHLPQTAGTGPLFTKSAPRSFT